MALAGLVVQSRASRGVLESDGARVAPERRCARERI